MSNFIYQLVYGTESGQVHCAFHDDNNVSAGVSVNGEYNCFACGASGPSPVSFVCRYFSVQPKRGTYILRSLENSQKYKYREAPVSLEQRVYLNSIGIIDSVIDKYMFQAATGKLMYAHRWNGFLIGTTWFNAPTLSTYNASSGKYRYNHGSIGGIVTPFDTALLYNTLIITEGEKDMLVTLSQGIPNVVAKIGGAKTYILGGVAMLNKQIIIIYDCDDAGREGAIADANALTRHAGAQVKVVDLQLGKGEDLADYFTKYNKTKDDLYDLIRQTPIHKVTADYVKTKVSTLVDSLSEKELQELRNKLNDIDTKEESD